MYNVNPEESFIQYNAEEISFKLDKVAVLKTKLRVAENELKQCFCKVINYNKQVNDVVLDYLIVDATDHVIRAEVNVTLECAENSESPFFGYQDPVVDVTVDPVDGGFHEDTILIFIN